MTPTYPAFKSVAAAVVLTAASSFPGSGAMASDASPSPWAANLSLYMWLPGVNGDFSAGPFNKSVDASFIDIAGKLRNFPLAFMGRFEVHYERLGLYLDGNYMDLDFKPRFDQGISKGLSSQLGIMEYGAMYRVFGPAASERIARWSEKPRSNLLDLYAGGRTFWLDNQIEFKGIGSAAASKSFTTPVVGGRFAVEFTPAWFVLVDGNVGGFGVDDVKFAASVLGTVGYRTTLFGMPASVEAGYKALHLEVNKQIIDSDVTMNGPFIGLTGYW
jgi:hypothetical protein